MAKTTDKVIKDVVEKILEGNEIADIRHDLYSNGFGSNQVDKIIITAKDEIRVRVEELKDILPELNLHRLNQLYVTSINAAPKDRAYIVREMNQMIGLYKQEVDLNVGFNFVIDENDDVAPDVEER